MSRNIDNSEDVMDSRDIQAAAEKLKSERDDLKQVAEDRQEELDALGDCTEENKAEYDELAEALDEAEKELADFDSNSENKALLAFNEEGENLTREWCHGETVIRRDHFVDYCRELVSDIGDMPKEIPSYIEIDWQKTANNLEADYGTLDFDGVEYLVRSC